MDLTKVKELFSSGQYLECYTSCIKIAELEPKTILAWKYAGKSLIALKRFTNAKKFLCKAHELDSEDLEIITEIGDIFLGQKDVLSAHQWYSKAIENNNKYAPALFKLGMLKQFTEVYEEAINLFREFISLMPKSTQAHIELANCYLKSGFLVDAELSANCALSINKTTPRANLVLG